MKLYAIKLSNEHIPFIYHVFEQNRAILHGNYISTEEWNECLGEDADPYEVHFIIMSDDMPAAWLKLNGLNEPTIGISMLVVDDEYKHKGVGRFAIQYAEKYARDNFKSAIRIQTTKDNILAKECYLKCGYEIVREMIYQVGDGACREGFEFQKLLRIEDYQHEHIYLIRNETLLLVLSKMLGTNIVRADYQTKQLHGGTLGDVRLVTGIAETADGEKLPYNVVLKTQKKWERPGDPVSWRREYDLYVSGFGKVLTDSFRWPKCYHAETSDNEIRIWMEYIGGTSGDELTIEMLEHIALELGRFQGRLYSKPELLRNLGCLGDTGFMKREYEKWHKQTLSYEFLISNECRMPGFLKQMLKDNKIRYNDKTLEYNYLRSGECDIPEHLKRMLIDIDDRMETVFRDISSLPIVLCHRDFWIENIFFSDGDIRLIDWDCAGWGYIGEDIASLIADETDVECLDEYYKRLVPAYHKCLSEYMDISKIEDFYIWEMIIIKFGYRILQTYMFSQSTDVKKEQISTLQKIYEIRGGVI